jgi:hypothetical protein
MAVNNPRLVYLRDVLGLSHDPFAAPVAEQELKRTGLKPYFFSYYTNPLSMVFDKPLIETLRQKRSGLIFGQPGSGKTTLRYTLEAECRSVYDRTLVVSYEPGDRKKFPRTADAHWRQIAEELAIDLFIQVVEWLDTFGAPTPAQKKHLQTQMALVWKERQLARTVALLLAADFTRNYPDNDVSQLWPRLNRASVQHVNRSAKIVNLLKEMIPASVGIGANRSGEELLLEGVAAAKAWGFEKVFLLVDGIDAYRHEVKEMLPIIEPLLDNFADWQHQQLFFYLFLTEELEPYLRESHCDDFNNMGLTFPPICLTLEWDEETLIELLHRRLQAADSRLPGFDALTGADFKFSLDGALVEAAQHSPRRLLKVVSALIDAHAQNQANALLITPQDWQRMQESWPNGSPLPPHSESSPTSP